MRRVALALAAVATAATTAAATASDGPAGALARATPVVEVADDFYSPVDVKIKKGQKVKWVWSDLNVNTHNVALTNKRPKGVKRGDYKSPSATVNAKYAAKFKKPGKYGFVCTFHRTIMKMTVVVKKN